MWASSKAHTCHELHVNLDGRYIHSPDARIPVCWFSHFKLQDLFFLLSPGYLCNFIQCSCSGELLHFPNCGLNCPPKLPRSFFLCLKFNFLPIANTPSPNLSQWLFQLRCFPTTSIRLIFFPLFSLSPKHHAHTLIIAFISALELSAYFLSP